MNNLDYTGSKKALLYYKNFIQSKGYIANNKEGSTDPEHLLWMCDYCIANISRDNLSKISRWLGFIQGCLISQNFTTVNRERDRTRPWFTGEN